MNQQRSDVLIADLQDELQQLNIQNSALKKVISIQSQQIAQAKVSRVPQKVQSCCSTPQKDDFATQQLFQEINCLKNQIQQQIVEIDRYQHQLLVSKQQQQSAASQDDYNRLSTRFSQLKSSFDEQLYMNSQAQLQISTLNEQIKRLKQKYAGYEQGNDQLGKLLSELKGENFELKRELKCLKENDQDINDLHNQLVRAQQQKQQIQNQATIALQSMRSKVNLLEKQQKTAANPEEVEEKEKRIQQQESRLAKQDALVKHLQSDNAVLRQRQLDHQKEAENAAEMQAKLEKQLAQCQRELRQYQSQYNNANQEMEGLRNKKCADCPKLKQQIQQQQQAAEKWATQLADCQRCFGIIQTWIQKIEQFVNSKAETNEFLEFLDDSRAELQGYQQNTSVRRLESIFDGLAGICNGLTM